MVYHVVYSLYVYQDEHNSLRPCDLYVSVDRVIGLVNDPLIVIGLLVQLRACYLFVTMPFITSTNDDLYMGPSIPNSMKMLIKLQTFSTNANVCKMSVTLFWLQCVTSLGPSNAIWQQRSRFKMAQVMACCLTAPSCYLNQL